MNTYERQVVVNDKEGKQFVCTMEDGIRSIPLPRKLEELSEHERRSCVRFLPDSLLGLSDFEE